MRIFLPFLCVLCAAAVRGVFDGTCLRKEPPHGVLVLSPGSKLVLTCSGQVTVDAVKVSVARNSSNTNRRVRAPHAKPATASVISYTGDSVKSEKQTVDNAVSEGYHSKPTEGAENRRHTGYTASPTTHPVWPTSVSTPLKAGVTDGEGDYEEEEEGSRVTRGIKSGPQWRWNGRTVGKGDRDWGEIAFEERGATLSLSSVRPTDSGRYTCHHRDTERFSLKVIVADPPKDPGLYCYKRSPSSKIRCEWTSQQPVTIQPTCYLLISKSPMQSFHRFPCSYSTRLSRCWCALDHKEDERRTFHTAFLCVTSIAGNATSGVLNFTPLGILKPDPPSNVAVQPEVGRDMSLKVTWSLPRSWKSQDDFYSLKYEIKYRPLKSPSYADQTQAVESKGSHTITDVMPGVEYMIQLRTREEYDGNWSDWSEPVCNSSWTAPLDVLTTDYPSNELEGSGTDMPDVYTTDPPEPVVDGVPYPVLWISASFAVLSLILAAYIFRHKDRFMSKLHSLSVVTKCTDSPPPSAPTAPEAQALVTFAPPRYKEPPTSEVEEGEEDGEEEQQVEERMEAMHFNNSSYFFLQPS